ncbi:MAG: type III secretion system chaperone [Chlamydiales bacterium]|nr:type III secretion system chaperone [Chlamydiales bacterium]
MIERHVDQLRKELGYDEPLTRQDDGSFFLEFEPGLNISVKANMDGSGMLFCLLAPLPKENREEFLKACMVGNLFGRETGGAALGVDASQTHLCLSLYLPEGIPYREFHDCFEDFLNYSDAWRREALVFAEVNGEA